MPAKDPFEDVASDDDDDGDAGGDVNTPLGPWLEQKGLGEYATLLRDNGFDDAATLKVLHSPCCAK